MGEGELCPVVGVNAGIAQQGKAGKVACGSNGQDAAIGERGDLRGIEGARLVECKINVAQGGELGHDHGAIVIRLKEGIPGGCGRDGGKVREVDGAAGSIGRDSNAARDGSGDAAEVNLPAVVSLDRERAGVIIGRSRQAVEV